MKEGNTIIGVYGTLRKGGGLHSCLEHSKYLGSKTLTMPYRMYTGGIPYLCPAEGEKNPIVMEFYEVNPLVRSRIDSIEAGYVQTEWQTSLEGQRLHFTFYGYHSGRHGKYLEDGDYIKHDHSFGYLNY